MCRYECRAQNGKLGSIGYISSAQKQTARDTIHIAVKSSGTFRLSGKDHPLALSLSPPPSLSLSLLTQQGQALWDTLQAGISKYPALTIERSCDLGEKNPLADIRDCSSGAPHHLP